MFCKAAYFEQVTVLTFWSGVFEHSTVADAEPQTTWDDRGDADPRVDSRCRSTRTLRRCTAAQAAPPDRTFAVPVATRAADATKCVIIVRSFRRRPLAVDARALLFSLYNCSGGEPDI